MASESRSPPHSTISTYHPQTAGERHGLPITDLQMLRTELQVLAYRCQASPAHDASNLLGFLEGKLGK